MPFDKVLQKRTSLVAAAPARRLSSTDGLLLQVQGLLLSSFYLSSPFSLSLYTGLLLLLRLSLCRVLFLDIEPASCCLFEMPLLPPGLFFLLLL